MKAIGKIIIILLVFVVPILFIMEIIPFRPFLALLPIIVLWRVIVSILIKVKKRKMNERFDQLIKMEEHRLKRPVGVSILAALHIAGGVIGSVITAFLAVQLSKNSENQQDLGLLGLSPLLLTFATVFLCVLIVASGIGMWKGRRWGWYLGSFYYVYGVIRNLTALVTIPILISSLPSETIEAMQHNPGYYYVKHSINVVIHFFLFLYFFKGNVMNFFTIVEQKKLYPIVGEVHIPETPASKSRESRPLNPEQVVP